MFGLEGWAGLLGGDGVLGDEVPDRVATERAVPAGREQGVAGIAAAFFSARLSRRRR
jgi:hypothetical protein